ncbi:Rossmann-like and DUF2520 domain-containing protein [Chitinilyticum piscinae]|uniref:DUF2520 domain-containing protein n=1 Tax=Chitinilyticum piscinae TaxID=2866724 RepID=A0A8J7FJP8_9NEIS|nr:Rossmann-like and DUF2520 domain-containing protein [Chitinilyticum piscinae]MBE9609122.1 DUF2520 domain-containing protein [Chitinilyticum piscinae]
MPTFNLIGPGRLGKTLARLLVASGNYQLLGIAGGAQPDAAREFIGAGEIGTLATLPPADFWLIAVPDGAIADVARQLAAASAIRPGDVVFHCSGAGEAALLAPLQAKGAKMASLHPVFSFADPALAAQTFAGTRCALEGDALACERLEALVRTIGGEPFRLAPGGKAAYHAALCVASNYLVTLSQLALDTAALAGMNEAEALPLLHGLMTQTLANVGRLGPAAALTGPIVRGDAGTVATHRAALGVAPALDDAYCRLGLATVALAGPRLTAGEQAALLTALSNGRV